MPLSETEVFSTSFNPDGSMLAVGFSDGELQIVSTMLGDKLYSIQDDDMRFPVTSLCWRPTTDDSQMN